jgi:hypothetical protein
VAETRAELTFRTVAPKGKPAFPRRDWLNETYAAWLAANGIKPQCAADLEHDAGAGASH